MRATTDIPCTLSRDQAHQVLLAQPVIEAALRDTALLRGLMAVGAGFSAGPHSLRSFAPGPGNRAHFIFCLKGAGWCEVGGRLHAVREGDLVAVPVGVGCVAGSPAQRPWSIHWVSGAGALIPEFFRELGATAQAPVIHVGEDPQVVRLFSEILVALRRGGSYGCRLRASNALGYLLAVLIQRRQDCPPENPDTIQKVAGAIIYMSEHIAEQLRVSALARSAGLSLAYFCEVFRAQAGCSPREYLHLLRIHRACQLLRATTLSIKEVAGSVGYADPLHFSRRFKAFEGTPPSDYRRSVGR